MSRAFACAALLQRIEMAGIKKRLQQGDVAAVPLPLSLRQERYIFAALSNCGDLAAHWHDGRFSSVNASGVSPITQYALLRHETRDDFAAREDPSRSAAYWDGWMAYCRRSNKWRLRFGCRVPAARHRHQRAGRGHKCMVHDGPYADSKEQLGGFYVIEVSDLDAALAWAAKCPSLEAAARRKCVPLAAPRPEATDVGR